MNYIEEIIKVGEEFGLYPLEAIEVYLKAIIREALEELKTNCGEE